MADMFQDFEAPVRPEYCPTDRGFGEIGSFDRSGLSAVGDFSLVSDADVCDSSVEFVREYQDSDVQYMGSGIDSSCEFVEQESIQYPSPVYYGPHRDSFEALRFHSPIPSPISPGEKITPSFHGRPSQTPITAMRKSPRKRLPARAICPRMSRKGKDLSRVSRRFTDIPEPPPTPPPSPPRPPSPQPGPSKVVVPKKKVKSLADMVKGIKKKKPPTQPTNQGPPPLKKAEPKKPPPKKGPPTKKKPDPKTVVKNKGKSLADLVKGIKPKKGAAAAKEPPGKPGVSKTALNKVVKNAMKQDEKREPEAQEKEEDIVAMILAESEFFNAIAQKQSESVNEADLSLMMPDEYEAYRQEESRRVEMEGRVRAYRQLKAQRKLHDREPELLGTCEPVPQIYEYADMEIIEQEELPVGLDEPLISAPVPYAPGYEFEEWGEHLDAFYDQKIKKKTYDATFAKVADFSREEDFDISKISDIDFEGGVGEPCPLARILSMPIAPPTPKHDDKEFMMPFEKIVESVSENIEELGFDDDWANIEDPFSPKPPTPVCPKRRSPRQQSLLFDEPSPANIFVEEAITESKRQEEMQREANICSTFNSKLDQISEVAGAIIDEEEPAFDIDFDYLSETPQDQICEPKTPSPRMRDYTPSPRTPSRTPMGPCAPQEDSFERLTFKEPAPYFMPDSYLTPPRGGVTGRYVTPEFKVGLGHIAPGRPKIKSLRAEMEPEDQERLKKLKKGKECFMKSPPITPAWMRAKKLRLAKEREAKRIKEEKAQALAAKNLVPAAGAAGPCPAEAPPCPAPEVAAAPCPPKGVLPKKSKVLERMEQARLAREAAKAAKEKEFEQRKEQEFQALQKKLKEDARLRREKLQKKLQAPKKSLADMVKGVKGKKAPPPPKGPPPLPKSKYNMKRTIGVRGKAAPPAAAPCPTPPPPQPASPPPSPMPLKEFEEYRRRRAMEINIAGAKEMLRMKEGQRRWYGDSEGVQQMTLDRQSTPSPTKPFQYVDLYEPFVPAEAPCEALDRLQGEMDEQIETWKEGRVFGKTGYIIPEDRMGLEGFLEDIEEPEMICNIPMPSPKSPKGRQARAPTPKRDTPPVPFKPYRRDVFDKLQIGIDDLSDLSMPDVNELEEVEDVPFCVSGELIPMTPPPYMTSPQQMGAAYMSPPRIAAPSISPFTSPSQMGACYVSPQRAPSPSQMGAAYVSPRRAPSPSQMGAGYVTPQRAPSPSQMGAGYVTPQRAPSPSQMGAGYVTPSPSQMGACYVTPQRAPSPSQMGAHYVTPQRAPSPSQMGAHYVTPQRAPSPSQMGAHYVTPQMGASSQIFEETPSFFRDSWESGSPAQRTPKSPMDSFEMLKFREPVVEYSPERFITPPRVEKTPCRAPGRRKPGVQASKMTPERIGRAKLKLDMKTPPVTPQWRRLQRAREEAKQRKIERAKELAARKLEEELAAAAAAEAGEVCEVPVQEEIVCEPEPEPEPEPCPAPAPAPSQAKKPAKKMSIYERMAEAKAAKEAEKIKREQDAIAAKEAEYKKFEELRKKANLGLKTKAAQKMKAKPKKSLADMVRGVKKKEPPKPTGPPPLQLKGPKKPLPFGRGRPTGKKGAPCPPKKAYRSPSWSPATPIPPEEYEAMREERMRRQRISYVYDQIMQKEKMEKWHGIAEERPEELDLYKPHEPDQYDFGFGDLEQEFAEEFLVADPDELIDENALYNVEGLEEVQTPVRITDMPLLLEGATPVGTPTAITDQPCPFSPIAEVMKLPDERLEVVEECMDETDSLLFADSFSIGEELLIPHLMDLSIASPFKRDENERSLQPCTPDIHTSAILGDFRTPKRLAKGLDTPSPFRRMPGQYKGLSPGYTPVRRSPEPEELFDQSTLDFDAYDFEEHSDVLGFDDSIGPCVQGFMDTPTFQRAYPPSQRAQRFRPEKVAGTPKMGYQGRAPRKLFDFGAESRSPSQRPPVPPSPGVVDLMTPTKQAEMEQKRYEELINALPCERLSLLNQEAPEEIGLEGMGLDLGLYQPDFDEMAEIEEFRQKRPCVEAPEGYDERAFERSTVADRDVELFLELQEHEKGFQWMDNYKPFNEQCQPPPVKSTTPRPRTPSPKPRTPSPIAIEASPVRPPQPKSRYVDPKERKLRMKERQNKRDAALGKAIIPEEKAEVVVEIVKKPGKETIKRKSTVTTFKKPQWAGPIEEPEPEPVPEVVEAPCEPEPAAGPPKKKSKIQAKLEAMAAAKEASKAKREKEAEEKIEADFLRHQQEMKDKSKRRKAELEKKIRQSQQPQKSLADIVKGVRGAKSAPPAQPKPKQVIKGRPPPAAAAGPCPKPGPSKKPPATRAPAARKAPQAPSPKLSEAQFEELRKQKAKEINERAALQMKRIQEGQARLHGELQEQVCKIEAEQKAKLAPGGAKKKAPPPKKQSRAAAAPKDQKMSEAEFEEFRKQKAKEINERAALQMKKIQEGQKRLHGDLQEQVCKIQAENKAKLGPEAAKKGAPKKKAPMTARRAPPEPKMTEAEFEKYRRQRAQQIEQAGQEKLKRMIEGHKRIHGEVEKPICKVPAKAPPKKVVSKLAVAPPTKAAVCPPKEKKKAPSPVGPPMTDQEFEEYRYQYALQVAARAEQELKRVQEGHKRLHGKDIVSKEALKAAVIPPKKKFPAQAAPCAPPGIYSKFS
ncbi:hypothetical protein ACFFRR_008190 [Megaselia abdita]